VKSSTNGWGFGFAKRIWRLEPVGVGGAAGGLVGAGVGVPSDRGQCDRRVHRAFAGAALFEYTYPRTPACDAGGLGVLSSAAPPGRQRKIALGWYWVVISVLIALS